MLLATTFHAVASFLVSVLSCNTAKPRPPAAIAQAQDCTITWDNNLPSWFPLVVNTSSSQIIYPRKANNDWKIVVPENKNFTVSCSSDSKISLNNYEGRNEVAVQCSKSSLQVNRQLSVLRMLDIFSFLLLFFNTSRSINNRLDLATWDAPSSSKKS